MLRVSLKHLLKTRPVSSTFPATAVPEMRASRIEETSEAADVTWYVLNRQAGKEKKKSRGQQVFLGCLMRKKCLPGFAVAYERAATDELCRRTPGGEQVEVVSVEQSKPLQRRPAHERAPS